MISIVIKDDGEEKSASRKVFEHEILAKLEKSRNLCLKPHKETSKNMSKWSGNCSKLEENTQNFV